MTTLASLPSELLGLILYGKQTSYCAIALWKCGDTLINLKLASGLEFLHLKDKRLASTSRYPKLISSLKNLRFLYLNRGDFYLFPTSQCLSAELQKIQGHRLETLGLKCSRAMQALRRHRAPIDSLTSELGSTRVDDDITKSEESSSSHEEDDEFVLTAYERGDSFLFDMESIFPRLRTLHVIPPIEDQTMQEEDLAGLPQSLTTLKYPSTLEWFSTSDGLMAKLPRSLCTIDGHISHRSLIEEIATSEEGIQQMLRHVWSDPPPSLTHLGSISPPAQYRHNDLSWLPRTLTSYRVDIMPPGVTAELCHTLPPNTEKIHFHDLDLPSFSWDAYILFSKLPSTLTDVQVSGTNAFLITPHFLTHLPRSLTKLTNSIRKDHLADWKSLTLEIEAKEQRGLSFWPPGLSTLIDYQNFLQDLINQLPKSLTWLEFRWDPTDLPTHLLPASLTQLVVKSPAGLNITSSFPSSIVSLTLELVTSSVNRQQLAQFAPQSLRTLNLIEAGSNLRSNDILPSMITSFSVGHFLVDQFACIPRTVTSLSVRFCHLPPQPLPDHDYFQDLPPSICRLHLAFPSKSRRNKPLLSGSSFSALKQLRSLEVRSIAQFEPEVLCTLPPSLTRLRMELVSLSAELGAFINPLWRDSFLSVAKVSDTINLVNNWIPEEPMTHFKGEELIACADRISYFHDRATLYPDPRTIVE